MKKLILTLTLVISSCYMFAQERVQIKGKVISISKKYVTENKDTTLSVIYPLHTTFMLSDEKFIIDNMVRPIRYKLFDKDVVKIQNEWVISYMTMTKKQLKLIVASEINGYPNHIIIAVIPFENQMYYTEYLVKIKK